VGEFNGQSCCRGGGRTYIPCAVRGHDRDLGSVPRLVLELRAERISCSRAIGGDIARLRDVGLGLNMEELPGPKTMGPLGWVEIHTSCDQKRDGPRH
jgi:hypothetical protein